MKRSNTKDELFLVKLYELALAKGDVNAPIDHLAVGRAIGQNDKGAYVIARDLAQANFIKKAGGTEVYLTSHGLCLVEQLIEEMQKS